MERSIEKYTSKRSDGNFKIQITSMVDMFVILLVFLLKSYSTSPVNLTPSSGLKLPQSSSAKDPVDAIKMVVSQEGVFVEDKKVVEFVNGDVQKSRAQLRDPLFIRPLYEELDRQAGKTKKIAKLNETVEFDGKVILQADKSLSYHVLRRVMYTSMLAGYSDVKLAVISSD